MKTVSVDELARDARAQVAAANTGEQVVITDQGQPVALLLPYPPSRLQELIASGRVRPHRRTIDEVPAPTSRQPLSQVLAESRNSERY